MPADRQCPICKGSGKITHRGFSGKTISRSCTACRGKGELPEHIDDVKDERDHLRRVNGRLRFALSNTLAMLKQYVDPSHGALKDAQEALDIDAGAVSLLDAAEDRQSKEPGKETNK